MTLRKANNILIDTVGSFFPHYRFYITKKRFFRYTKGEFEEVKRQLIEHGAAKIGVEKGRILWWTKVGFCWTERGLTAEEVDLLVWEAQQKEEAKEQRKKEKFDRLREMRSGKEPKSRSRRKSIPSNVKKAVWKRDEGKCTQCGTRNDLQFDHIIPVARGGASTIENIQILCGICNRRKSDSIV